MAHEKRGRYRNELQISFDLLDYPIHKHYTPLETKFNSYMNL